MTVNKRNTNYIILTKLKLISQFLMFLLRQLVKKSINQKAEKAAIIDYLLFSYRL